ncbi:pilus assembly protein [Desulfatitalea alkaliphila]|uniref:Type IV pilus assembly protein PilY1 n=1 Tax=Desulfatitalea alkaliphila TaxID=2929485 RepID=A0AA41QYF6_9BACT|nr:hypothetical protein [Desulfatitalea alkaliphila]MCJ8499307.1 hypothetical protein [Desulfatitalea alkaliphila]
MQRLLKSKYGKTNNSVGNRPRTAAAVFFLVCLLITGGVASANNDWQAPRMADYVKLPPFVSFDAKPNIMILLDNSGSMNAPAYDMDYYAGEPYNSQDESLGVEESLRSYFVVREIDDVHQIGSDLVDGEVLNIGDRQVGIRFQNVDIPQGSIITEAYIQLTAYADGFDDLTVTIRGEDADDAAFFNIDDPNNLTDRTLTSASADWTIGPWQAGEAYDTSDISAVLQAIVSRQEWRLGNALVLTLEHSLDAGYRRAEAHLRDEDDEEQIVNYGPVLHVKYQSVKPGVSYYGYFNPKYFYEYRASDNTFHPKYQKINYDYSAGRWNVRNLSGTSLTLNNTDIAPVYNSQKQSQGLWDGNWANWLSMRRIDVMRKVLVGGKADPPLGNNNGLQKLIAESPPSGSFSRQYSKTFSSHLGPPTSPYHGNFTYDLWQATDNRPLIRVRYRSGWTTYTHTYTNHIQKDRTIEPQDFLGGNLAGILQRVGDRARWGNMWFNQGGSYASGGKVANPVDHGFSNAMLQDLQTKGCDTWTPLAETFYVALQYFKQQSIHSNYQYPTDLFQINQDWDPYYDKEAGEHVPCAKSFVLLLTDGASTMDGRVPIHRGYASNANNFPEGWQKYLDSEYTSAHFNPMTSGNTCNEGTGAGCIYPSSGTDYLADLALYARHNDLRPDLSSWEDNKYLTLYTVLAFGGLTDVEAENARALLKKASLLGGYGDSNSDGIPDTYFEADDGYLLEKELLRAISDMLSRTSSGTAASVVSGTRSGEGAVYQAIFQPQDYDGTNTVYWTGQVNALLVDAYGNMREDTTGDQRLDVAEDLFLVFCDAGSCQDDPDGPCCGPQPDFSPFVRKFRDINADGQFDAEERAADPVSSGGTENFALHEVNYLWTSSQWLNSNDLNPVFQRNYTSNDHRRYIFTFVDADGSMVPNSTNAVKDFIAYSSPEWMQLTDPQDFFAYLHTYEPFTPPAPFDPDDAASVPEFRTMVSRQAERVVNFIRGEDQPVEFVGGVKQEFRSRQIVPKTGNTEVTWRLGDIVHSSPTVVSRPAENFDLLYGDRSYTDFYRKYRFRRTVLYVGSNGGMLHALNGGFFDESNKQIVTRPVDNLGNEISMPNGSSYNDFPLGAELWAYVPFNLLPHLYWLTKPDYEHVYFMDLEPRIFDARIFAPDADHPNGWGTVLVAGMRFGGGKIAADMIKGTGPYNPDVDRVMSSAYAVFDITNPEMPPRLLAELTFPELGFTTCHPGVILMQGADADNDRTNQWYLIFGSGPASRDAFGDNGANTVALVDGISTQNASMYAVDLVALAQDGQVRMVTPTGLENYSTASGSGPYYMVRFDEPNSSVSKPIVVDWDLNYNSDAVYFGTSSGDHDTGWTGRMRRLVLDDGSNDPTDPKQWQVDSILLDSAQPIMAAPTPAVDGNRNRWVYFGTGRFYSQKDKADYMQQSYYGVKEPYTLSSGEMRWTFNTVSKDNLFDVSNIDVFQTGHHLDGYTGTFWDLADEIEDDYSGWRLDFPDPFERNLGQATLAGQALTFTTFSPADAICASEGQSQLYALYYRTGTAYINPIIGASDSIFSDGNPLMKKRLVLGPGMTITPNIHVGRQKGASAFVATEGGPIEVMQQQTPASVKSGQQGWMPDKECD